ncbi:PNPOx family protein [Flindersiella endophytica]
MKLPEETARERFARARVARLATVGADGQPHLVPVVFALQDDVLVIAVDNKPKSTHDLKRLRNIAANPLVSVLVDRYADDWTQLWWVRADGRATVLTNDADRAEPLAWLSSKYSQYVTDPPPGPVIRVEVTSWRGWSAS